MKKTKPKSPRKINRKLLVGVVFIALLIAGQGYVNYFLWRKTLVTDPSVIRSLIISSGDALYRDAPVDAQSGDLYIPEARLRIPRVSGQSSLHYSWYAASSEDDQDEEVYLSAASWTKSRTKLFTDPQDNPRPIEALFAAVPNFQVCSRQFLIKFTKRPPTIDVNYVQTESLTLADGRTAFLYEHKQCTSPDDSFTGLYFKNLRSY